MTRKSSTVSGALTAWRGALGAPDAREHLADHRRPRRRFIPDRLVVR